MTTRNRVPEVPNRPSRVPVRRRGTPGPDYLWDWDSIPLVSADRRGHAGCSPLSATGETYRPCLRRSRLMRASTRLRLALARIAAGRRATPRRSTVGRPRTEPTSVTGRRGRSCRIEQSLARVKQHRSWSVLGVRPSRLPLTSMDHAGPVRGTCSRRSMSYRTVQLQKRTRCAEQIRSASSATPSPPT